MSIVRIGVDVGGTFTDFSGWRSDDDGGITALKVPSTPPDFFTGFKAGFEDMLNALSVSANDQVIVMHGTTITTNTVIERTAAPIALLVTAGFRDVLQLQRLRLRNPVNLFSKRAEPIVPRNLVFEVPERLDEAGNVLMPVDRGAVEAAVNQISRLGIRNVAVVLLHSFTNPAHEIEVRNIANALAPEIDVSISSEVQPIVGEYERAVNTTLNAYVKPRMGEYLTRLEEYLAHRAENAQLFMTRSNGGAQGPNEARQYPITTLLSGPASAVTAALSQVNDARYPTILSFDMGGTSVDVSLIQDGKATATSKALVGDFSVTLPVTEIRAIGAGGGSIVKLDGPVLRVGPQSAGAYPGPAAFGLGGTQPTLMDAYAICGYLNPLRFLGGRMQIDLDLAHSAFNTLASQLRVSTAVAADASISVATSSMVSDVLPFLAAHGSDPQVLTLVASGGNGGIHGPLLAYELGVRNILIPARPSVFSAQGGLLAALTHDFTQVVHGSQVTGEEVASSFLQLREAAAAWLEEQVQLKYVEATEYEAWAEMRYRGQSFQVPIRLDFSKADSPPRLLEFQQQFHSEHERLYAHSNPELPVELVSMRVRVIGTLTAPTVSIRAQQPASWQQIATRSMVISGPHHQEVPVYSNPGAPSVDKVFGPCLIEEDDSTIFVPSNYSAYSLASGAIELALEIEQ